MVGAAGAAPSEGGIGAAPAHRTTAKACFASRCVIHSLVTSPAYEWTRAASRKNGLIWSHLVAFAPGGTTPSPSMDRRQSQRKASILVGSRLALWGRQQHLKVLTWFESPPGAYFDDRQNHLRDVARPGRLAKGCHCKMTTRAAGAATMPPMLAVRRRPASSTFVVHNRHEKLRCSWAVDLKAAKYGQSDGHGSCPFGIR